MVFRESELTSVINTRSIFDEAYDLLSEAVYLTEDESFLSPVAVPVVENSRLGMPVVNFTDVERLSEENGIDYGCAVMAIAEANGLSDVCVAVSESEIIMNPDLCLEMDNIVISEMPDSHVVYQYTEACLDTWLESGDMNFLVDYIEDTYLTLDEASATQFRHPTYTGIIYGSQPDPEDPSKRISGKTLLTRILKNKGESDSEISKKLADFERQAKEYAKSENNKEAKKGVSNAGTGTSFETDKISVTTGAGRSTSGFSQDALKQMRAASDAESKELKKNPAEKTVDERNRDTAMKTLKKHIRQTNKEREIRKMQVMGRRNAALAARAARDAAASAGGEESKLKESESYLNKIKQMCWNKPKKFIADKIAAIRKWAHNVQNSTDSGIWMKIKKIVAKVITTLEGWLAKAPAQAEESTADAAEAE